MARAHLAVVLDKIVISTGEIMGLDRVNQGAKCLTQSSLWPSEQNHFEPRRDLTE